MNRLKERKDRVEKAINRTKLFIILVIFIILLPVFLTELYLKSIGLGAHIIYEANYVYGYSPMEKQEKIRLKKKIVRINEGGLRSLTNWEEIEKNSSIKILFLGDSVTYGGSYIDEKDTFTNKVCSPKNKIIKNKKKPLICGNAGVNSYGIFNIVFRSRYDERIQDAEIVIFILVGDDFYRGLQKSDTAHFYLNKKKFPFPAITEAINFIATKYDVNKYISKSFDYNIKNKNDLVSESINLLQSEIIRLKDENKKVLLFYSPSINQDGKINSESKYIYDELKNKISENIISLSNILSKEMFVDSVHYNKLGHEEVSKKISIELNNLFK